MITERDANSAQDAWVLAIDTATDQAGLALLNNTFLSERSWNAGRQQTVSVLPMVDAMLANAGIGYSDLKVLAVTIGPGSFTGLRVGLSIAKGIVIAHECALVGVPTLEVLATPLVKAKQPCIVAAGAGRGRVLWAAYGEQDGPETPVNSTFDEFLSALANYKGWTVAGEFSPDQRAALAQQGVELASVVAGIRRPGGLAEIGLERWRKGVEDDPVLLEPTYLHGRPNRR